MSKNLFSICSSLASVATDQTGDIRDLLNVAKLELCCYAEIADRLIAVGRVPYRYPEGSAPESTLAASLARLANLSIRPALSVKRRTLQTHSGLRLSCLI
jgi:hypothetical protein